MNKNRRLGTKARVKDVKERQRHLATAIFLLFILLMVALSVYFGYTILNQRSAQRPTEPVSQFLPETPDPKLKAAIVDQLSLTFPNQTFVETVATILEQAGYTVDYYAGEEVTVEFYRNLPTHGYKLMVLRVHSTAIALEGGGLVESPVSFFTSEPYDQTKYTYEQLTRQLAIASYNVLEVVREVPHYFALLPEFVTFSMKDLFQNTTIIMMGCQGLNNTQMAEAFMEKGVRLYVGWSQGVSASHTDQATTQLLQHLVTQEQTIKQAVENTMKEVGPDPIDNSVLRYYPVESGNQVIQE